MNRIFVIDFCDTLVFEQTADNFIYFCLKSNPFKRIVYKFFKFIQKSTNRLKMEIIKKEIFAYLIKGLEYDSLQVLSKLYSSYLSRNKVNKVFVEYLKNNLVGIEDTVIIISNGYYDYIYDFIKENSIRVDEIFASKFEVCNRKLTGKYDNNFYGKQKAEVLQSKYDLATFNEIIAISDSLSDMPLFNIATRQICVNPDKKLRKIAEEKEWLVI